MAADRWIKSSHIYKKFGCSDIRAEWLRPCLRKRLEVTIGLVGDTSLVSAGVVSNPTRVHTSMIDHV